MGNGGREAGEGWEASVSGHLGEPPRAATSTAASHTRAPALRPSALIIVTYHRYPSMILILPMLRTKKKGRKLILTGRENVVLEFLLLTILQNLVQLNPFPRVR